jgi:hypothetical protein
MKGVVYSGGTGCSYAILRQANRAARLREAECFGGAPGAARHFAVSEPYIPPS